MSLNCINKTHWRTDPWFIYHFSKECCQAHITWSYQISTPVISEFQPQGGNCSSSALREHYVTLTTQVQSVSATRRSNWKQYTGHQICKLYRYKFYFFPAFLCHLPGILFPPFMTLCFTTLGEIWVLGNRSSLQEILVSFAPPSTSNP